MSLLLKSRGLRVIRHDDLFGAATPDVIWLRKAGEEGWIVLTRDQNIRKHPVERQTIIEARVRTFVMATAGKLSGDQIENTLARALNASSLQRGT